MQETAEFVWFHCEVFHLSVNTIQYMYIHICKLENACDLAI